MFRRLFATHGEPTAERVEFAVVVWLAVFAVWLITWFRNWFIGPEGPLALPDVPTGVMALLAALPVSKALAGLRKS